jgi:outer membrane protein assembly factor BamB
MRRKIILAVLGVFLLAAGAAGAYILRLNDTPEGSLDTDLSDITVRTADPSTDTLDEPVTTNQEPGKPEPRPERCWTEFGGNPQRTLYQPVDLGRPLRKPRWSRGVGGLMEYGPSFCDGKIYVNTQTTGLTIAFDAKTGRRLWTRRGGAKASTPAIVGPRLVVTSQDGTVQGMNRANGKILWEIKTGARVESSPVAMEDIVYFGATDGRLFAVNARSGAVRWAYDTGGRINSSPSIWGDRICISTYAGSIFCLRRTNGSKLWSTYVKRNVVSYESFYSSPSTDGRRLYTIARSGKLVALDARSGRVAWTHQLPALGYATPAIAHGRLFLGTRAGGFYALDASSGRMMWSRSMGGAVAGSALVVGDLVFASTVGRTVAMRVGTGETVWRFPAGHFVPGIATDKMFYLSMSGLLVAFKGEKTPRH